MKTKIIAAILVLNISFAYSQEVVIPPSPTAASLGKYADIQVSLYTGKPNITVPIWEIKENSITLPISLNYLADGIKLEEIASWVGLGWSLNAGGVIARSVRGNPDDNSLTDTHTNWWDMEWPGWIDSQKHYAGYGQDPNYSDYDYIPYLVENMSENEENVNLWHYLKDFKVLDPTRDYKLDGEPDVFYFNFLEYSGVFYFDKDGQISPEIYYPFIFKYDRDDKGNIVSFQITDDKGVNYIFEDVEETELTNTSYSLGYNTIIGEYNDEIVRKMTFNSAWYLSKIESPTGQEVSFTYVQEEQNYNTRLSQYYDASIASPDHVYGNYASEINISSLRLSSIETDIALIKFDPGNEREDLEGTSKVLNEIQIFNKLLYSINNPIRRFKLEFGYFLSPNVDNERPQDFKRLYLSSVQEIGENDLELPLYVFGYNYNYSGGVYLPERLSFEQDLWGYYNANGSTNSLIPELHVYPGLSDEFRVYDKKNYSGTHHILDGDFFVDRLPNETKMKNCVLNRVTFPTGGYRDFEFEAHRFLYDGSEEIGGGLRIKKITNYDNTGVKLAEREYEYKMYDSPNLTSGLAVFMPQFAYKQNSREVGCNPSFGSLAYYENAVIIHNVSLASLGSTHGSAVGYRYVKEIENGNGYTYRRYATPGMYEDMHDSDAPQALPRCSESTSGFCDGIFKRARITYRQSLIDQQCNYGSSVPYCVHELGYCGVNLTGLPNTKAYPYVPSLNYDWNRGFLLEETNYNNNDKKVKKVEYDYSIYNGDSNPKYIKCLKVGSMENFMLRGPLFAYSFYDIITNVAKLPIRKTETTYSSAAPGDESKAITVIKEYDYNEKLLLKEEKLQLSDGGWSKTEYRYPNDIDNYVGAAPLNPVTRAVLTMSRPAGNMLSFPIETIKYKNDEVIDAIVQTYVGYPAGTSNIQPYQTYSLEINAPLSNYSKVHFNSTLNPSATLNIDSSIKFQ